MSVHLFYIGDPLLDIAAECDSNKIIEYGLRTDDWVRADERHERLFQELLHNPSSSFVAGGSAQNSARIAKWLLGDKGIVSFSGCVGKDDYAKVMRSELEKDDVKPLYVELDSLSTGLCACLTGSDGKRSMCSKLGAAAAYEVSHLQSEQVQQAMETADAIFVASYFLTHSPKVFELITHFCHLRQKMFAVSLSAAHICESYAKEVVLCLRYADLVFGNSNESRALMSKITGKDKVGIEESVKWIADLPKENVLSKRTVVISSGAAPVVVCTSGKKPVEYKVPSVNKIVDTIGCGDALASGFLATYVLSKSVDKSVKIGIEAAYLITQTTGCTLPDKKLSVE